MDCDHSMTMAESSHLVSQTRTTPKRYSERQKRLRQGILGAARELITRKGYEGVNMRELAKTARVTPKTLYYQYGSKEELLRTAVEEMFARLYAEMDATPVARGIDRVFFIIDKVAELTNEHRAYSRALMPFFTTAEPPAFSTIRRRTYARGIEQIASEGEFENWVDVPVMASLVYRQVNPIYQAAWITQVPVEATQQVAKHDIGLMIAAASNGYTRERAVVTAREMQRLLNGATFI
jgi:AcrR family transcriptional regulator